MAGQDATTLIEQVLPDLFVASFFVPAPSRPAVLTILGFEAELSNVALQVAEPMVAQIRYAWWREQVDAVFHGRPVHAPSFQALVPVLAAHALPRPLFDELVDAHGRDCEASPFADLQDMEEYAVSSCGSVLKLVARILGAGHLADIAAEHAGAALGLARQLQEYRHWASHERQRIPADLAQDPAGAVRAVQEKIAWHLAELDRQRVDRRARPALAAAAMARVVAGKAFDPIRGAQVTNWQRLSRIAFANLTGRI